MAVCSQIHTKHINTYTGYPRLQTHTHNIQYPLPSHYNKVAPTQLNVTPYARFLSRSNPHARCMLFTTLSLSVTLAFHAPPFLQQVTQFI